MIVSMSRVETLLDFSALEAELIPDQKKLHAEDVEIFIDVLLDEATEAGVLAYEAKMADLPEEDWSWNAVRARTYWKPDATFGDAEELITRGPPALSLVLARRPELEPELAGDEIPDPGSAGWTGFWQALGEWQIANIRAAMGPVGWIPMENDPKTALDPTEPPVDPVLLPGEIEPPIAPGPSDSASPNGSAAPSGGSNGAAASPTTPTTTPSSSSDEAKPSLTRAALKGAGIAGAVAVLGGLTYYALRPEESAS